MVSEYVFNVVAQNVEEVHVCEEMKPVPMNELIGEESECILRRELGSKLNAEIAEPSESTDELDEEAKDHDPYRCKRDSTWRYIEFHW